MPLHKNYQRATLETLIALGLGTTWYYLDRSNQADYDHDVDLDNLKGKFVTGDGYSYDNNPWMTNVNHVTAGAAYYLLARSNDLSMLESFLYSTGASLLWEYGTEIHEDVSINDSIMNPFGGFAVGEVMYQLGEFFQHSEHNRVNDGSRHIIWRPLSFPPLAGQRPAERSRPRRTGLDSPPMSGTAFGCHWATSRQNRIQEVTTGSRAKLRRAGDLELINLSQYNHPGVDSSFYAHSLQNVLNLKRVLEW